MKETRRWTFMARRAPLPGIGGMAVLGLLTASLLAASGCTTSEEVTYVGYSAEENRTQVERREPRPDDPLPPIGNVQVINGDTLRMSGGQILRLHGIRAPEPGEPYYHTARRWLSTLVGHQVVRFSYKEGTKFTDDVWYVNLLVPTREQQRGGANSANALMLANGLAREAELDTLRFARVNEETGKLEPLNEEHNEAIRELFQESAREARQEKRNIYSGVREP